eukprot:TRINITY_DN14730_c0_g1_i4.p1 TRINITY_DN14730_c0_g1~~TRINITY_DN14730_c0_g1_i4.p1  ORF type:complete len:308 (-),score=50.86 TRINITY_DN14730_c0_g1_i4:405-1328(-)
MSFAARLLQIKTELNINSMVLIQEQNALISGDESRHIEIWDIVSGQRRYTLAPLLDGQPLSLARLNLRGVDYLAAGDASGALTLWSIRWREPMTGQSVKKHWKLPGRNYVQAVIFLTEQDASATSLHNDAVVVSGSGSGSIRFRTMTGEELIMLKCEKGVKSLIFHHDLRYLISGDDGGKIVLWDLTSKKRVRQMSTRTAVLSGRGDKRMAIDYKRRKLIVGDDGSTVTFFDLDSRSKVEKKCEHKVWAVAYLPVHDVAIAGDEGGHVTVWDMETLQKLKVMRTDGQVRALATADQLSPSRGIKATW